MRAEMHSLDLELQEFYTKNKDGKGSGYAMRAIQQYANNYARLQIEKHNDRIKEQIERDGICHIISGNISDVIRDTPIELI